MTDDEQGIHATLDGVYAAWAENDADAFVRGYAENATAQLPGTLLPDRCAIHATMTEQFAGPLKGSSASYTIDRIRFAGDGAAVVTSQMAIRLAGEDEPAAAHRSLDTWVLARHDAAWRVIAYHNCPALPGGG